MKTAQPERCFRFCYCRLKSEIFSFLYIVMSTCIVEGCSSRKGRAPGVSFHRFPQNFEKFQQWHKALPYKTGISTNSRVCSLHFTEESYSTSAGVTRLKPDAVPVFLAKNNRTEVGETVNDLDTEHAAFPSAQHDVMTDSLTANERSENDDRSFVIGDGYLVPPTSHCCTYTHPGSIATETAVNMQKIDAGTQTCFSSYHKGTSTTDNSTQTCIEDLSPLEIDLFKKPPRLDHCYTKRLASTEERFQNPTSLVGNIAGYLAHENHAPPSAATLSSVQRITTVECIENSHHSCTGNPTSSSFVENLTPSTELLSQTESSSLPSSQYSMSDNSQDVDYEPSTATTNTSDSEDDTASNSSYSSTPDSSSNLVVVFESQLDQLFLSCRTCGSCIAETEKTYYGSLLVIRYTCNNHHTHQWYSQPTVNRTAIGNLRIAAAILFSGNTYSKISHLSACLNLAFLSEAQYYTIQKSVLFPTVRAFFKEHQEVIWDHYRGKEVTLIGDGRCDSPGHSAKYLTYTLMDMNTGIILASTLVQVTETGGNSTAMEKEGFSRAMTLLEEKGIVIKTLCTDRHVSVRALMRRKYPHVKHQFDVWQLAKSICKRLTESAKRPECVDLMAWIPSIKNHLWWCSEACGGNAKRLKEMWTSIIHHTANIHQWTGTELFNQCRHPVIGEARLWLEPGTGAHNALKAVVLDRNILRDLEHVSEFCHTGALEVFHSEMLKYCPKRQHFFYEGMSARTCMAVIDHNLNCERKQQETAAGEACFRLVFSKATSKWVVKPIYEGKSYAYLQLMMKAVLRCQCKEAEIPPAELDWVPRNIATKEKPDKKTAIREHISRFKET